VFRVVDYGDRGWLYGARGRESSTAIGYGCQPGGWVGNRIAEAAGLVRDRKDHEVISSRDNLVFHQMQTNHGRCLSLLEVAADSLAHVMLQLFQTVCLGKDRVAQGAGFIASFRRLLDREDDFIICHIRFKIIPVGSCHIPTDRARRVSSPSRELKARESLQACLNPGPRVEIIAKRVPDEIERQHGEHHGESRKDDKMRRVE